MGPLGLPASFHRLWPREMSPWEPILSVLGRLPELCRMVVALKTGTRSTLSDVGMVLLGTLDLLQGFHFCIYSLTDINLSYKTMAGDDLLFLGLCT